LEPFLERGRDYQKKVTLAKYGLKLGKGEPRWGERGLTGEVLESDAMILGRRPRTIIRNV